MDPEAQAISNVLCWFCGQIHPRDQVWEGHCLGRMVYSSETIVSDEELRGEDRDAGADLHFINDRSYICRHCIMRYASNVSFAQSYLIDQLSMRDEAAWEALDFDVQVVSWAERRRLFNCWFERYSCLDASHYFKSLPLLELFKRGWTLTGAIRFEEPQIGLFLQRFADNYSGSTADFDQHLVKHITTSNPASLSRIAAVRATISDLTVTEFAIRDLDCFSDATRR